MSGPIYENIYRPEVQCSSVAQSCLTFCNPMDYSTPSLPVHHQLQSLLKLMSIESVMPSNNFIFCLFSSPPAFILAQHQDLFNWVSSFHQVAKVLQFQLQHQSFQCIFRTEEITLAWTGWISLQSKGLSRVFSNTTLQKHQFFSAQLSLIVQFSHPYMTTGKTTALARQTVVGKIMSLLFNMLSRLVKIFLPRSECLLISWLQSPSICTDFGAQQNQVCHCFCSFFIYLP